jgi:hypothetical protein
MVLMINHESKSKDGRANDEEAVAEARKRERAMRD